MFMGFFSKRTASGFCRSYLRRGVRWRMGNALRFEEQCWRQGIDPMDARRWLKRGRVAAPVVAKPVELTPGQRMDDMVANTEAVVRELAARHGLDDTETRRRVLVAVAKMLVHAAQLEGKADVTCYFAKYGIRAFRPDQGQTPTKGRINDVLTLG